MRTVEMECLRKFAGWWKDKREKVCVSVGERVFDFLCMKNTKKKQILKQINKPRPHTYTHTHIHTSVNAKRTLTSIS